MPGQDLHAHSTFDDGKSSCEEMVRAAAAAGLESFGISAHSPLAGRSWTVPRDRLDDLRREMARLRRAYEGQIRVYTGLEYDIESEADFAGFDYVIASVHILRAGGREWPVDNRRADALGMIRTAFHGAADAAAAFYFSRVKTIAGIPGADIVGHFDLLTKFNEQGPVYDTSSFAYRRAALDAMEALVKAGKIFELNTGGVSRGYRTGFYPEPFLLEALREMGGKLTISSDSHAAGTVAFAFKEAEEAAVRAGFRSLWTLTDRGFAETPL